jgi:hypothetical protein
MRLADNPHALQIIFLLLLALPAGSVEAQTSLPLARNVQTAIERGTRTATGAPGAQYWQNTADYDLAIRFEPASRQLSGSVAIAYRNNSPDTLRELWFKLYPNLYQKGAPRLTRVDADDLHDGVRIDTLAIDGRVIEPAQRRADGTNLRVRTAPIAPGQTASIRFVYAYPLNRGSHIRTGQVDTGAFFIAYFFPRVAVYDDIDGWNRHPYLGPQEFYNDYGNFRLAVTVPDGYVAWATGNLVNCGEALGETLCERLALAEKADSIVTVIGPGDLARGLLHSQRPERTFRFEAQNVPDVAIGLSNRYVWRSTSVVADRATGRRTRVEAVYNPAHRDYEEVVHFARGTVEAMRDVFPRWPFPYPHVTVFDGLDQMEYPMIINDNPLPDRAETIELTDHEIMHMMFPFYVGTNETKYAWMDEGWATLGEWIITAVIDSTIVDDYGVAPYERLAGAESDVPVATLSTLQSGQPLTVNSYGKPALGLRYAMELLGDDRFFRGLHQYIRTWQGRHPLPHDFFQSMNAGSGVNLDWFWRRWFYETGAPDLAITGYNAGRRIATVEAKGAKPVPIELTVTYTDGTTQTIRRTVSVWEKGAKTVDVAIPGAKAVRQLELGGTYVPDVRRRDNVWKAK